MKGYKPDYDFIEGDIDYYNDKWINEQIEDDVEYIKNKCSELGLEFIIPKGTDSDYLYYLFKDKKEIAKSMGKDVRPFKLGEIDYRIKRKS